MEISVENLQSIIAELSQPFNGKKKEKNGNFYIPIGEYEKRLKEVVGTEHYSCVYGEPQLFCLTQTQAFMSLHCTIKLLDNAGACIYATDGVGTRELTYSEKNASYISLNTVGVNLQYNAFISACKSMQMFSLHEKGNYNEGASNASGSSDKGGVRSTEAKSPTSSSQKLVFWTKNKFEKLREDKGKPVYRLQAHLVVGESKVEQTPSNIIFYPNQYAKAVETFNNIFCLLEEENPQFIHADVKRSEDHGDYIFRGFWK